MPIPVFMETYKSIIKNIHTWKRMDGHYVIPAGIAAVKNQDVMKD